jgi:multidrug efflux pump subunit AcrB
MEVDGTSASGVSLIFVEVDYRAPTCGSNRSGPNCATSLTEVAMTLPSRRLPPDFDDEIWTEFVKIIAITVQDGRDTLARRSCDGKSLLICGCRAQRADDAARQAIWPAHEEVRVELDETRLSMLGISIDEVSECARKSRCAHPGRPTDRLRCRLTVELTGEFTDLESVRDVIVEAYPTGASIRVSDLGESSNPRSRRWRACHSPMVSARCSLAPRCNRATRSTATAPVRSVPRMITAPHRRVSHRDQL